MTGVSSPTDGAGRSPGQVLQLLLLGTLVRCSIALSRAASTVGLWDIDLVSVRHGVLPRTPPSLALPDGG